jgi:hypothetical protein
MTRYRRFNKKLGLLNQCTVTDGDRDLAAKEIETVLFPYMIADLTRRYMIADLTRRYMIADLTRRYMIADLTRRYIFTRPKGRINPFCHQFYVTRCHTVTVTVTVTDN